ncbi:adhesion G protein-coupled receptor E5-like [Protopterus annectens]|uniref:adhesion G protein-coupled receptor E5-like n=1 Tax=Protopterus annectens TaxID=7888 RepID=UPI001CFB2A8A|nr:adhesion G protein-coupled receptor E5-like [Protopterus annectens]
MTEDATLRSEEEANSLRRSSDYLVNLKIRVQRAQMRQQNLHPKKTKSNIVKSQLKRISNITKDDNVSIQEAENFCKRMECRGYLNKDMNKLLEKEIDERKLSKCDSTKQREYEHKTSLAVQNNVDTKAIKRISRNWDYVAAALITYEDISANMQPESGEGAYKEENKTNTALYMNTDYEDEDYQLKNVELVSRVISATISNINRHNLANLVNITFKYLQAKGDNQEMRCAFLNNKAAQAFWSYEGCETVYEGSNVTCQCNHLSSFAVLMALYEIKSITLAIITYVGLGISLICLAISIFTFYFCRAIRGPRTTIHLHLCVCLFMGYFIFLVGINQTKNEVGCGVVAGLLHYFFLATFTWMCLEGVQLYLMVVEVFSTNSLKKRYMFAFGYGLPLVIVILSASINAKGYGTKKYCWLSLQHGFLWSFLAPVCVIILVNSVIFIITVWKLAEKFSSLNPDLCKLKKIRAFTITAIAQLCILGCTWIFGIFQIEENTIVISYIFTIFNCFQGLFIFILHCLMKKQVKDDYMQILANICNSKMMPIYSQFTSTTKSSMSQVRKRNFYTKF